MNDATDRSTRNLPSHIQDTIQAIARLHADHRDGASRLQSLVDRFTDWIGRPRFLAVLTIAIVVWVDINLFAVHSGWKPLDAPPFNWLQCGVGLMALFVTILILTTQRREDELAEYREQLTLELAILAEQKSAKIIALLEEIRRDSPTLANRSDAEAAAMAMPADPGTVLDALKEGDEMLRGRREGAADRPARDRSRDRSGSGDGLRR